MLYELPPIVPVNMSMTRPPVPVFRWNCKVYVCVTVVVTMKVAPTGEFAPMVPM